MPTVAVRAFLLQVIVGTYVGFRSIEGIEHYMLTLSLVLILILKELDHSEFFDQFQWFRFGELSSSSVVSSMSNVMKPRATFAPPAFSQFPTSNLAVRSTLSFCTILLPCLFVLCLTLPLSTNNRSKHTAPKSARVFSWCSEEQGHCPTRDFGVEEIQLRSFESFGNVALLRRSQP